MDFLGDKNFRAAANALKESFSKATDFSDVLQHFRYNQELADTATSELMLGEDPKIALGALYVINSLIRHGELPAELKS